MRRKGFILPKSLLTPPQVVKVSADTFHHTKHLKVNPPPPPPIHCPCPAALLKGRKQYDFLMYF